MDSAEREIEIGEDHDHRSLPTDLVPLPTMPYSERPLELPLDIEECRTAIWRCNGNVTKAASLLKISSLRLRRFINNSPYLSAELREATDQIVDIAEEVIVEALLDREDKQRRDGMAKFVATNQGRERGWGQKQNGVTINAPKGGKFVFGWADDTDFAEAAQPDNKMIEGDFERVGNDR